MKKKFSFVTVYSVALLVCDIAVTIGAFLLGLWLTGWNVFPHGDIEAILGLVILSLASISFFQTYQLYSYHFLFSRKEHLRNIAKSFCWSSFTIIIIILFLGSPDLFENDSPLFMAIVLCGSIVMLFLSRYFSKHILEFLMAFGFAVLFVGMTGLACKAGIPVFMTNKFVILICFVLAVVLLTITRLLLVHVVFNKWLRRRFRRQVAIVGSDSEADSIARYIIDNNVPFWVVGTVGPQLSRNLKQSVGKKCLGEVDKLTDIVEQFHIDDLIITDETIDKTRLVSLLDDCISAGIDVWLSPKLLPIIDVKLRLDNFCGLSMILLCSQKNTWLFDRVKHIIDVLLAFFLCCLFSPLFLLISVAIKLDSKGPVFYLPQAIGKNGVVFSLYKFRSMKMDSDNKIHKDYVSQLIKGEIAKEEDDDTPLKITNDPRVTKVGKLIRKYSLDELPQLINVLKDEMSLVGPRPCLPYEFEMYKDWHKKRTAVRGGITGLWQVTGRSEVSFDDMILLDLYYIYNRSFALDFNILFETLFVVLGKKGAY